MILALIATLLCLTCVQSSVSERAFLFTTNRVLGRNETNKMTLNLYEVNSGGQLIVSLMKTDNDTVFSEQKYDIESGVAETVIEFVVPNSVASEYEARLQINGTFDDYQFSGEDVVTFKDSNSKIVFIQTDKPLYKAGQTVKFRVLPVNSALKPLGSGVIGDIFIEDPMGSRVAQWKKQPLGKGIHQFDLPLSDEANLGFWRIAVSIGGVEHSANFEVKEYVLPKYEVIITPPSYVLVDAEVIPIDVCAKYTYGKQVEGILFINTTIEAYSWSSQKFPAVEYEVEFKGCHKYFLNVSLVDQNFQYSYRRIKVFAEVKEKGTGIIRNETKYIDRTQTPLQINFETESKYFKPGLPYYGKIKVTRPDDTRAPSQPVEICVTVSRERKISDWWASRKVKYCRNYTSDGEGIVRFSVPSQNTDAVSMSIEAKSTKYGTGSSTGNRPTLYNPQMSTYLRPWYSPSGSHIQVQDIGTHLECDTKRNIKVLFTTKKSDNFQFFYEIINRSQKVKKGFAQVEFEEKDDVSSEQDVNDVTLEGQVTQIVPPTTSESELSIETEGEDEDRHCKAIKDSRFVPFIGSFNISVDVTASLSSSFHVLVYYIREDRETVADSQHFMVEKCLDNKVGLKFADEVKQPGAKTSLTLTASPNSLCGIKVVDKSVILMDSNDQLTKKKIFEALDRIDSGRYYPRNHCNDKQQPGLRPLATAIYPPRPPRPWASSSYEDAITAFEKSGLLVISDLILVTRPCKSSGPTYEAYGGIALASVDVRGGSAGNRGRPMPTTAFAAAAQVGDSYEKTSAHITKSVVDVRTQFPETWLFDLEEVGESGRLQTKHDLPHTITEWIGNAVCINEEKGLGLSDITSIKGFQAFFLSFTLPYSIVRGEKVPVIVTVFNYLEKCLPISLAIEQSGDFVLLGGSSETELCVCGGESESYRFNIEPTVLGKLDLTVFGRSASSSVVCGEAEVSDAVAKDAITNSLIVEAEGFPQEEVTNVLFCPKDSKDGLFKRSHSYILPNDTVEDSARGYVSVSGDIMGPTVQGLDKLVQLPTGCGEQNMVLFAPIIYVLDYLYFTNQLKEETKNKGLDFLKKGYQRELRYRHSDGSFSAFGPSDREGSLWLTSFVLRSFSQSQKYIEIDQSNLNQTKNFILSKQMENGCFLEVGKTLSHAMQGGLNKQNSSAAFTAYVITSLMISGLQDEKTIEKALGCIETDTQLTPYKAALFGYTAALAGNKDAAEYYLDILFEKANTTGGQTFWRNPNLPKSVDIETAAYAILCLLKLEESLEKSLPIVRWLTKSRNSNGGFVSTQDTVLGLEALSKYGLLLSKEQVNLEITLTGALERSVTITDDDKLLVKKIKLDAIPSDINIEATGSGCGLIQTILRYNSKTPPKKQFFSITINARRTPEEGCKYATLHVCTSYLPEGKKSNMALIELKMVSGMAPVKESLETLKEDRKLQLKRHEFENNNLVFYFDEMSNEKLCFEFVVEEIASISDRKPSTAKVYDYYATEQKEETSYTIGDCKGI